MGLPEMAANRPMITLQCGNYANYIGAHFWNLQVAKLPAFPLLMMIDIVGVLCRRLDLSTEATMEGLGNYWRWTTMCCSGRG